MGWAGLDSSSRWANQTKVICKNLRRWRDGNLCRRYLQLGSLEVQFRYCIVPQLDTVEEQAVAVPFEDLLKSRLSYVHSKSPFRKRPFGKFLTVVVVDGRVMKSSWHLSIWYCWIRKMSWPSH